MTKPIVPTKDQAKKIEKLQIWDNHGETYDRYTVVWPDGTFVGMSERPTHPQGFHQYGEGAPYYKQQPLTSQFGKAVTFRDISLECQKCIIQDIDVEEEQQ